MKKNFLLFATLCFAHVCFAQLKVNSTGNVAIGGEPLTHAKLSFYSSDNTSLSNYGLYSVLENTANGCHIGSSRLYGAYFKNKLTHPGTGTTCGVSYGVFVENANTSYNGSTYGVYVNNLNNNYASSNYGFYTNNNTSGYSGTTYGVYSKNMSSNGYDISLYGIYSENTHQATSGSVYGVYSIVSGGNANNRYSGYFTGGKVFVNDYIYTNGVMTTSDERLKSDIKPLTSEKDKLYLLQGKSYKKTPVPVNLKDSSSSADKNKKEEEIIEFPEYGFLAQELKEIFPDLVSQDSAGYYSVNYIGLIPVIIEAMKEQRSENEKQQIQIDEQREQIKQLVKLMGIKSIDKKVFEENGIESIPLLLQNTPNPFSRATEIGYFIPETVSSANIYIYDVNGVQQRNISITERGNGITVLQATSLQAGIYFYTLICDGKPVDTRQMILTR
jgi:hypothetical protein